MEKSARIASFLLKSLRKANRAYGLITDGDRIAVGVSGGKDSQTLLRLLHQWQAYAPVKFELAAVHISTQNIWPETAAQTNLLENLFQALDLDYTIQPFTLPSDEKLPLDCFRCSWNRRKALFLTAQELNCNKVALGHHANDIVETALLNLVYHGRLESMAPKQAMFEGEITLIRPLALIEEKDIVYYARSAGFLKQSPCCPHGDQSKRSEMKKFLKSLRQSNPQAQVNLFRAVERASNWREPSPHSTP